MATAGADARIAIWTLGRQQPDQVLEGHRRADRFTCCLAGRRENSFCLLGPHRAALVARRRRAAVLEGHSQNVNGVAFTPDGQIAGQRGLRS